MDWDDVRTFLAIARGRSLSAAARELGVRQSTMSRRLEGLEQRAGARLLERTPRGYALTALGEAVLGNAERMEAEAIAVERLVQGRDVALSGVVRLTTVDIIAELVLPSAIARLQAQYPGIAVDVLIESRAFNLSRREADVAIRMTRFEGNAIITRRVATLASALYASEAYVATKAVAGGPATDRVITVLEDQAHLPEPHWLAERLAKAPVAMRSNSRAAQLAGVRAGLGVACLPCILGDGVPGVMRLSDPSEAPTREVWLGVHADLRPMPRVGAVIKALDATFATLAAPLAGL